MGLENLRKSLSQEAEAEAKRTVSAAQKQAEETVAKAKEEARQVLAKARERARQALESEKSERLGASQLRAKKTVTEARNMVLDTALAKAWEEFRRTGESKDYEKLLKRLISGAEKELGGKIVVLTNEQDAKIAKKFAKNVAQKAEAISGGAIVLTQDRKIGIDNSFEAIFDRKREETRNIIFRELFGEGK